MRDQLLIGKAENDPPFQAKFRVNIEGQDFIITRPVQYHFVDLVKGDVYQPIPVLPKLELRYDKENYLSLNGSPVKVEVRIHANDADHMSSVNLSQQYSKNWKWNEGHNFRLSFMANDNQPYQVGTFSSQTKETNLTEEIKVKTEDGKYDGYTKIIAYDHIPTITYFPKAKANLVKLDIKIIGKNIGYISGAGDKVAQTLEDMGYNVTTLTDADLNDASLNRFDAIVTGVRAYNIHEVLK